MIIMKIYFKGKKRFQPITKISHTPPNSATTLFSWQLKHVKILNKQKYLQNPIVLLQLLYHLSRINTRYMASMILRDLEINIRKIGQKRVEV